MSENSLLALPNFVMYFVAGAMTSLKAVDVYQEIEAITKRCQPSPPKLQLFVKVLLEAVGSYFDGEAFREENVDTHTDAGDFWGRELKVFQKFLKHYEKREQELLNRFPPIGWERSGGPLEGWKLPEVFKISLEAYIKILKYKKQSLGSRPKSHIRGFKEFYLSAVVAHADCLLNLPPHRSNEKADRTFHDFLRYCLSLINRTRGNEFSPTNVSREMRSLEDTDMLINMMEVYENHGCQDKFNAWVAKIDKEQELAKALIERSQPLSELRELPPNVRLVDGTYWIRDTSEIE